MSNVWKGITDNAKHIGEGARVAVNCGDTTLFWDHKWATNCTLRSLATAGIPFKFEGATGADIWDCNLGWKRELFADILPPFTVQEIAAHSLKTDSSIGDLLYWGGSSKDKFSIKPALVIIRGDLTEQSNDGSWDLVWKLRVHQRIKVFLWLVMHDRIMTNVNRFKRNIADDPWCKLCGNLEETTLHVLRDCKAAREVWRCVEGLAKFPSFSDGTLQQWIVRNIKIQARNDLSPEIWPTYFAIVIWWLWKWCNSVAFGNIHGIPIDANQFLLDKLEETWRIWTDDSDNVNSGRGLRQEAYIRWLAPPFGLLALNTDGAPKGAPGIAGGGGIIRDHAGKLAHGSSLKLGACNAIMAEAKALEYGLELPIRMQAAKVQAQLDSQALVQALNNDDDHNGERVHIIARCKRLLEGNNWRVEVHHIYREANRAAEWLTNHGISQNNSIELIQFLSLALGRILHDDVVGVAFPRLFPP